MLTRTCPRCHVTKPVEDFRTNRHRKDGLQVYCRLCQDQAADERYYKRAAEIARAWGDKAPIERLLTQEEVNLAWGLPADAEAGEAGNYLEGRTALDVRKQNRNRQAVFQANHPGYHKTWAKKVGYPTTTAGRALWRANRLATKGTINK